MVFQICKPGERSPHHHVLLLPLQRWSGLQKFGYNTELYSHLPSLDSDLVNLDAILSIIDGEACIKAGVVAAKAASKLNPWCYLLPTFTQVSITWVLD